MSPSQWFETHGSDSMENNRSNTIERVTLSVKKTAALVLLDFLIGEFDPGSERTLAAWIRHASRTGAAMLQWRKGEEHVNNLPSSWG